MMAVTAILNHAAALAQHTAEYQHGMAYSLAAESKVFMKCIGCDTPIPDGQIKCPACGAPAPKSTASEKIQPKPPQIHEPIEKQKTCPKCRTMINAKAKICPACHSKLGIGILGKFFLVFLGVGIFSSIMGQCSNKPTPTVTEQEHKPVQKLDTTRALAAANIIKQATRNPKSVKFISVLAMPDETICYKLSGQNGYGGNGDIKALIMKGSEDIVTSKDNGFNKKWNNFCAGKTGENITDYIDEFSR